MRRMWFGLEIDVVGLPPPIHLLPFFPLPLGLNNLFIALFRKFKFSKIMDFSTFKETLQLQ